MNAITKLFIFLFSFIIFSKIYGQPGIEWQRSLGGTQNDEARCVIQTKDGGYAIAGTTESNDGDVSGNHGYSDIWVVKLNSKGNIEWQKCFGGSSRDEAFCLIQTKDGGYIIAGITGSNDGDVSGNHFDFNFMGNSLDYWVAKLNVVGEIEWQRCLGGSGIELATSIQQTADNGYIVVGTATSNDGDVSGNHFDLNSMYNSDDYWIVKLSSKGELEWQKSLGGSSWDHANSIQQTKDSGYIIAGFTYSNDGDVSGNHMSGGITKDFWIVKLDNTGKVGQAPNIEWQKCLGGSEDEEANSISQTIDEGYIIAGITNSNDGEVSGNHFNYSLGGSSHDYWVVKLKSKGELQWERCLGGSDAEWATSIRQLKGSGYIMAGWAESTDGDVIGNHKALTYNTSDMWVVRLKNNGDIKWQKCLGGNSQEIAYGILQTIDNGYVVAGWTASDDGDVIGHHGNYSSDMWIVKLNGDKCPDSDSLVIATSCSDFTFNNQTYTNSGVYTQTLTNVTGCDSTITLNLTISKASDTIINKEENSTFSLNGVVYTSSGIYTQHLKNTLGCDSTITLNLTLLKGDSTVYIPTAFTPNNDGLNDIWRIKNINHYYNALVQVYNRWGEKIYNSVGYKKPWDGKADGKDIPSGVYHYIIDLRNGKKPLSGSVTIFR